MIRFKKKVIANPQGEPYLVRWQVQTPWGAVMLHHILRSDEDRDVHDHPWSFLTVLLKGGYFEHRYPDCWWPGREGQHEFMHSQQYGDDRCAYCNHAKANTIRTWHGVGAVLWRKLPSPHRLELPEGKTAWSLVFRGPHRREWGFHTICGFIPWPAYSAAKEEGC